MRYFPLVAALVVVGGCGDDGSGGKGSGGNGASCTQRLAFELVCPGDVAMGATGQVTVEGYDANNMAGLRKPGQHPNEFTISNLSTSALVSSNSISK